MKTLAQKVRELYDELIADTAPASTECDECSDPGSRYCRCKRDEGQVDGE